MKKQMKKLTLNRETLFLIASPELSQVAGATAQTACASYCIDCNSGGLFASRCVHLPCDPT